MAEDDEPKVKKEREPIAWACFIVFLIASVAVLGGFVNDNYIRDTNVYAADGYTVSVNYTGAYYAYVNDNGAVVFDTSYQSVNDSSSILKSNDYTAKTSYAAISFTLGSTTTYLSAFMNAVIGHHAGETVKVKIVDAYPSADATQTMSLATVQSTATTAVITAADFAAIYGFTLTSSATITSAYGWPAVATFDAATDTVSISYNPTVGQTYTAYEGSYGKVTVNVVSVSAGTITYIYGIDKCVATGVVNSDGTYEIEMIKLNFGGNNVIYITAVDNTSTPSSIEYKTVAEKYNETMYFTIHIESVTKSSS